MSFGGVIDDNAETRSSASKAKHDTRPTLVIIDATSSSW